MAETAVWTLRQQIAQLNPVRLTALEFNVLQLLRRSAGRSDVWISVEEVHEQLVVWMRTRSVPRLHRFLWIISNGPGRLFGKVSDATWTLEHKGLVKRMWSSQTPVHCRLTDLGESLLGQTPVDVV